MGRDRVYRFLGLFCFGLGGVGMVVPLLPTVPLWILAALLFSRSEPALRQKIYDHPRFGATVRDFVERGQLSRRSKVGAILGAGLCTSLSLWIVGPPVQVLIAVAAIMAAVFVWLATRPEPLVGDGD